MPAKTDSLSAFSRQGNQNDRQRVLGVCLLIAGMVLAVFGQTLGFQFVNFDDHAYVYNNPNINHGLNSTSIAWAFSHKVLCNWHPLTILSHMLDCQLYGVHPWGHHLTNVLLHCATAALLFLALNRMTHSLWPSAFAATLFAVHPLRVESVAWISERKDVLSGVFFMLTLLAYASYGSHARSVWRYLRVVLVFALGLLCKPTLVTLPFVLLLLDWWPLNRMATGEGVAVFGRRMGALLLEKVPLLLLSAACSMITFDSQQSAIRWEPSLPWRVANGVVSYATYLLQTVWPANLAVFYQDPGSGRSLVEIVGASVVIMLVSGVAYQCRKSYPWILVGWLWFLGILVPTIGLVQVGSAAHADRYTYLPQIGLCIALTWSVAKHCPELKGAGWAFAIVPVLLALLAFRQTTHWRDSHCLWTHALDCADDNSMAEFYVGNEEKDKGNWEQALAHYRNAARIVPGNEEVYRAMGENFAFSGRVEEAIPNFLKAIGLKPQNPEACYNLGLAYSRSGQKKLAATRYQMVLVMQPENSSALNNLAYLFATAQDPALRNGAKAVQLAETANQKSGGDQPNTLDTLAAAYAESGRFPEAVATLQKAIRLAGTDSPALLKLLEEHLKLVQGGHPIREQR